MPTAVPLRFMRSDRPTVLAAMCEEHLRHLADCHYAESTLAVRRVHLGRFCAWATAQGLTAPGALTRSVCEAYRRHLLHYRNLVGFTSVCPRGGCHRGVVFPRKRFGSYRVQLTARAPDGIGLPYYRARYPNTGRGRFVTEDPVHQPSGPVVT